MAVRFDASTDALSRTTTLPSITSFTLMAWAYGSATSAGTTSIVSLGATSGSSFFYFLGQAQNASRLQIYNGGSVVNGTTAWATATWAHVALTCAGSGANQLLGYLNGVLDITTTGSASATNAKAFVGNCEGGDWYNGRIAAVKCYAAVLTADEIKAEMRSLMPVRTANLNTWSPLLSATALENLANTGAWTVGGTLTTEDGPPMAWAVRQPRTWRRAASAAPSVGPPHTLYTSLQAVPRAAYV